MLQAMKFINAIDADSKPITLRASDGNAYVTKWIFKRKENRRLVNEWLAVPVLRFMGTNCAEVAVIEISAQFIRQNHSALKAAFGPDFANLQPGPVFGSRIDEGAEQVANQPPLEQITNLSDFYAALVADVFLCQGDKRQAIFERTNKRQYRAKLIDNANALESTWWQFKTEANAVYADKCVYRELTAAILDRLIAQLQAMPRSVITNAVDQLPEAWIGVDRGRLQHVVRKLFQRQKNLRFLMHRWLHGEHADCFQLDLLRNFSSLVKETI
jgi:HipA-like kinase